MLHKIGVTLIMGIAVRRVLAEIKLIQIATVFVLAVYFIRSDRQEQRLSLIHI